MARSYSRDRSGRFAGGGSLGDSAQTVQQNRAKKTAERKAAKKALSGNAAGSSGKRTRSGGRDKTQGKRATTKRALAAAARSRKRFG